MVRIVTLFGLKAMLRCRRGIASTEFAIAAPFLCLGLLSLIDIGSSVSARMELDRHVRTGAQAALSMDYSAAEVQELVQRAGASHGITATVTRSCSCNAVPGTCQVFCADGTPPSLFYTIEATRPRPSPRLLDDAPLRSVARVQLR